MTDPIAACPEHGYAEGRACPVCDGGTELLSGGRRRQLSKFCSGALRHFPGDAGFELNDAGWTDFEALVAAVERQYGWADREAVAAVVATDPKGRFERTGGAAGRDRHETTDDTDDRVRAAYGHSVDVALESGGESVPETLYHGTAPRKLDSIRTEGLLPMNRQLVHLSGSVAAAREVGSRHADDPVILEVDAASMRADSHEITRRGRDVYTTERVPPAYLTER